MTRKSGSPLPVGSVASQSVSTPAERVRVRLQFPCTGSSSPGPQPEPFDLKWLTTTVNTAPFVSRNVQPPLVELPGLLGVWSWS